MTSPEAAVRSVFRDAECEGTAHCREIGSDRSVGFRAGEPVVAASVFKIGIALELLRQGEAGEIDLTEQVELLPGQRTTGPTGMSHFRDPARASLRDLAYLMLTISDNAATDEILSRVSMERVNATAADLGLVGTKTVMSLRDLLQSAGEDHGFTGWAELMEAVSGQHDEAARERATSPDLVLSRRALDPSLTNRTTAADMTRLLERIWTDRAGDDACAQVRWTMSEQIDRSRFGMASGWDTLHANPLLERAVPVEVAELVTELRRAVSALAGRRPLAAASVLDQLERWRGALAALGLGDAPCAPTVQDCLDALASRSAGADRRLAVPRARDRTHLPRRRACQGRGAAPWDTGSCRRGDLNPHVLIGH